MDVTPKIAPVGKPFDVVNPPVIGINDNVGSGATAVSAIKGSLKEIKVHFSIQWKWAFRYLWILKKNPIN